MNFLKTTDLDLQFGYYKYVRMKDNELRFCSFQDSHRSLVSEMEIQSGQILSAGTIKIRNRKMKYDGYGSSTLNVNWNSSDDFLLTKTLGVKYDGDR